MREHCVELFLFDLFRWLSIGIILAGFLAFISIVFPYAIGGPYVPSEMDDVRLRNQET